MHSLDWYIDAAKTRNGIASDNQLSRKIGINASSIFQWRMGRAWPKEEFMLVLADLAGVSEETALTDLHIWSAKSARTKEIWQTIARKVGTTAATLAIVILASSYDYTQTTENHAVTSAEPNCILWRLIFLKIWAKFAELTLKKQRHTQLVS